METKAIHLDAFISANLTREDRAYIEKIDARILGLLHNTHIREVKDVKTLETVLSLVKARGAFLRMTAHERVKAIERSEATISVLRYKNQENKELQIDLNEKMQWWKEWLTQHDADWANDNFPETLCVTPEQAKRMTRLLEMGFTDMLVIPPGLVDEPVMESRTYSSKQQKKAWDFYWCMFRDHDFFKTSEYIGDGSIGGSTNVSKGRIIMLKSVREMRDDPYYRQTLGRSTDDLNELTVKELNMPGFLPDEQDKTLAELGLLGLDEIAYWMFFRKSADAEKEMKIFPPRFIDMKAKTFFPASRRRVSGCVPAAGWSRENLDAYSHPTSFADPGYGTRLAARIYF